MFRNIIIFTTSQVIVSLSQAGGRCYRVRVLIADKGILTLEISSNSDSDKMLVFSHSGRQSIVTQHRAMMASLPPLDVISIADFQQIVYETIQYKSLCRAIDIDTLRESLTVDTEQILNPGGYMGDYYRIRITLNTDSRLPLEIRATTFEYFVKALPMNDATNLAVIRLTGMATRESHLFATLLPKLQRNGCTIK